MYSFSFLTLAMEGGEWSPSCPRYFNVGREGGREGEREGEKEKEEEKKKKKKKKRYHVSHAIGAGWPPEPVWTLQRRVKYLVPAGSQTTIPQLPNLRSGHCTDYNMPANITYKIKQCHNPQNKNPNTHCCENVERYLYSFLLL